MIAWLRQVFGSRPKRVASGPLAVEQMLPAARGFAVNLYVAHGLDVQTGTVANTNSMVPTLDDNCVLLLDNCPFDALEEGDMVFYRSNSAAWQQAGGMICHRLSQRQPGGWWPLGDNNARMDPELVTRDNYHRRVMGVLYCRRKPTTDL